MFALQDGQQLTPQRAPSLKLWLLLAAFVIGLVYLFLLPPWRQNDEPGQFEFAWLVAHLNHWPGPGDVDAQLRHDVLISMVEHGFFSRALPGSDPSNPETADIGVQQMDGMPLYYFFASLPLRLFPSADVRTQMYLARLVSLLFFVATVYFAVRITELLFSSQLLGWMIAVFIAMLPQLAYRMTAVNDDAAAVASMMFFIWMCARGFVCGPDWKTLAGIPAGAALCVLSKTTAWLAVPFGVLALLLIIFRARTRLVWAGIFGLAVLAVLLVFEWKAPLPAYFYPYYHQPNRLSWRAQSKQVVDGEYSIQTDRVRGYFFQVLDKGKLTAQTKETDGMVTYGVWVWANKPDKTYFPQLQFQWEDTLPDSKVRFTTQPTFISAQARVPEKYAAPVLRVVTNGLTPGVQVFWDCFVLVPGKRDLQSIPQTRENCSQVEWDGYSGENLIRNPSAEHGWIALRDAVAGPVSKFYGLQVTDFLAVFDPPTSSLYFQDAIEKLFRTFWGRFNWGTLALVGRKPYRVFVVLSILAVVGLGFAAWRYRKTANWNLVFFFLALMVADLIYTLSRFLGNWETYYAFLPQARYFFPVIFTAAFFICLGWYALLEIPIKKWRLEKFVIPVFAALFLLYNGWAWYTIWLYWYG